MNFYDGPAESAAEQLRRWDSGDAIWSIEMGGIGPGYEQAIQVLAIEIVRDNLGKGLPNPEDREWGMDTVRRLDAKGADGKHFCGGFSGAQVGAARNLAFRWLERGPAALHEEVEQDRRIQVSNFWPRAPKPDEISA